MNRQNIRLKEFAHSITKIHIPSDQYLLGAPQLSKNRAYFLSTDANGFISTGNFFKPDFTIAIVGDSFVENIFVDEIYRFESILERKFLSRGRRIKIINAGVSGMTGLGAFNLILNKMIRLKPDAVIFVQPSIDFSALLFENGYFNDSKLFANLTPAVESERPVYETINENKYQIFNNISLIAKVCELNGIRLAIATCASNSSRRQLLMMNSIIRENNNKLNYKVLDLDNILAKGESNFYDKQHLNANGSRELADILYNFIIRNFDLPLEKNIKLAKQSYSFNKQGNSGKFEFDLFQNDSGKVESWISVISIPIPTLLKQEDTIENEINLVSSSGETFTKQINVSIHKELQQTINISNLKPGRFHLKFEEHKGSPILIQDIVVYSVVNADN